MDDTDPWNRGSGEVATRSRR